MLSTQTFQNTAGTSRLSIKTVLECLVSLANTRQIPIIRLVSDTKVLALGLVIKRFKATMNMLLTGPLTTTTGEIMKELTRGSKTLIDQSTKRLKS